uniref:Uncharacterized protein n=1 Tax=Medicago truncatula TaxID=3880 RepID=I3SQP3_MEDTR|nr:unknown [Medicago truncatula]
MEPPLLVILAR